MGMNTFQQFAGFATGIGVFALSGKHLLHRLYIGFIEIVFQSTLLDLCRDLPFGPFQKKIKSN